MEPYQIEYEKTWKELIEVDGEINLDQVKRELFDYANLIAMATQVYFYATGGKTGNVRTMPERMVELIEERVQELIEEAQKGEKENEKDNSNMFSRSNSTNRK